MSMNTCNDGHDEVCYCVNACPVCLERALLATANDELAAKESQVDELKQEVRDWKALAPTQFNQ